MPSPARAPRPPPPPYAYIDPQPDLHTVSEILTTQNGEEPHDERPALVLDTNTVLALWMFRDPTLDRLRQWIEAGNCRLYSRADALEELRRVLAYRQFGLDDASQQTIISGYRQRLTPCAPATNEVTSVAIALLPRCSDADDQKFLEIAVHRGARHVLTRDKALLKLARQRTIRERFNILTPERFLGAVLPGSTITHKQFSFLPSPITNISTPASRSHKMSENFTYGDVSACNQPTHHF